MGIQGSGKGTQAKLLADDLDLEHFSVGDIFRWNVQHHTKLGAQVKRIMATGNLVDDDLVESVVRSALAAHDWNFGFVIDGFPRIAHRPQLDETCDICHGELISRADDNPEALAIRLADYHEETKPLIAIFERKEFVATIDATLSVEEVQSNIRERFALPPRS